MKEYILETKNLSKIYNGVNALNQVNVKLEQGKIYGLIGRNGAGKSTFMRLIMGLAYPSSGELFLFGKNSQEDLVKERARMGCMIENPSIELKLTAKENMKLHRILKGIPNEEIEDELLELVGLKDTGKKKVRDFSLGMKQRLGIAIALLGNPELLILDEPINGLDPIGVVEVRKLLSQLCEEKQITILISSHNLPELYQVATDYIIVHHGEVKQMISYDELEALCSRHILIECEEPQRLVQVLESELHTNNYKVLPENKVKLYDFVDDRKTVARTLFDNGIIATNFSLEGDTLENYFISVIGGEKDA